MYLCYMDESGDPGTVNSPTHAYAVSAVLVRDAAWSTTLDDLIRYRRWVRDNFGLRMREEVKANELVNGRGPWKGVGDRRRMDLYRGFLRLQEKTGTIKTFAVVIRKAGRANTEEVREWAWGNVLNRLEVFSRYNQDTILLIPDVGEYEYRRRQARRMRRFAMVGSRIGTAPLARPFVNLVEDPVARDSRESYFIQLADLNAYAAHRVVIPKASFPTTMWDNLGSSILAEASKYRPGPASGIVLRS